MFPPIIYTKGQALRLTYNGQTVKATVAMASSNGRSLALAYDGALHTPSGGLYVGMIALLWQDGAFIELVEKAPATIDLWTDA